VVLILQLLTQVLAVLVVQDMVLLVVMAVQVEQHLAMLLER